MAQAQVTGRGLHQRPASRLTTLAGQHKTDQHFAHVMSYAPIACTNRNLTRSATTLALVSDPASHRPAGLLVAAGGSLLVGVLLIGLAAAALAVGHGAFSGGVGVALIVYGAAMIAGAVALWRGSIFGRGPVIALALINLVAAYTFTDAAPWVWLLVVISAITVIAAALPSTSSALHVRRISSAGEPPPTVDQGK